MMQTSSIFIFPRQILSGHDPEFEAAVPGLIPLIYGLRDEDPNGRVLSNHGGWQSEDNLLTKRGFEGFRDSLLSAISAIISEQYGLSDIYSWSVSSCWANISPPGAYNLSHIHPGSHLSGTIYLVTPENCGNIVFENDPQSCFDFITRERPVSDAYALHGRWFFKAEVGTTLLFPSFLPHYVEQNKSNEDRLSVSFNVNFHPKS